jgi:hypothetical protein
MRRAAILAALLMAPPVLAERVGASVEPGDGISTYEGISVPGSTSDYKLPLAAGQVLRVDIISDTGNAAFTVTTEAGEAIAPLTGSALFVATITRSGSYLVVISSPEETRYEVTFEIETLAAAAPDSETEFWQVTGLTDGRLNLRAGAAPDAAVIARAEPGSVLGNRGCAYSEGKLWCRVELPTGQGGTAYAAGRYLRAAPPEAIAAYVASFSGAE